MKTKRVVVGGSDAFAGSLAQQSAPLVLAVALLGATALACKSGNSAQENAAPADQGLLGGPQGADVVRYTGMEVIETGQTGVRQAVQARRAADWSSPAVATLYPGTQISRVARYGNFSLVSWSGPGGAQQGWVDTSVAFSAQRILDAGAGTIKPSTVFGAPTGTTTTTTPPVTTATTPPVATATTPPVTTATTPPKATVTAPTATTPRGGFRPPGLK